MELGFESALINMYLRSKRKASTKLVLGNGFDLFCGLETKYIHFFNSEKEKYNCIQKWANSFNPSDYLRYKFSKADVHFNIPKMNFNIWDIYFALGIGEEDKNWCDIETEMRKTFESEDENIVHWAKVLVLLTCKGMHNITGTELEKYMASYILLKNANYSSEQAFYTFLLDELKEFENNFGTYVNKQYCEHKQEYIANSHKFFNAFSKKELKAITSKETFNYTGGNEKILEKMNKMLCGFHHINGDYTSPIFGVDSSTIKVGKPYFIFTKVSRRLISAASDGKNLKSSFSKYFSKLLVFGHSLNSNDYNYFFPIFDYLGLTNISENTSVIFAYYVYNEEKRESIILDNISKVTELIDSYEEYAGKNKDNRLIDSLTAQGRIKLIEIKK